MKNAFCFIFALLFFSGPVYCQPKELRNKILWDEHHPLTWDNFKGPENRKSAFYAETVSGIFMNAEMDSDGKITIEISTYFDPSKSWKKKKAGTDGLLRHEQNHFDISEVYARMLVKKISELNLTNPKTAFQIISREYNKANAESAKKSTEYDKETNHGIIAEKQEEWNQKVKKMLEDTRDYSVKTVTLTVKQPVSAKQ